MGINLCCGDIGMPKQDLNGTKIGSIFEEVSGQGMANRVRGHFLNIQTGGDGGLFDQFERPVVG